VKPGGYVLGRCPESSQRQHEERHERHRTQGIPPRGLRTRAPETSSATRRERRPICDRHGNLSNGDTDPTPSDLAVTFTNASEERGVDNNHRPPGESSTASSSKRIDSMTPFFKHLQKRPETVAGWRAPCARGGYDSTRPHRDGIGDLKSRSRPASRFVADLTCLPGKGATSLTFTPTSSSLTARASVGRPSSCRAPPSKTRSFGSFGTERRPFSLRLFARKGRSFRFAVPTRLTSHPATAISGGWPPVRNPNDDR
jgi:hypothetical protein